jgi:hypothetical protein
MADAERPEALEAFVRGHIQTAEELEALLLLHRSARRWWTVDEVARALQLERDAARRALERLSGAFLEVRIESDVCFRFAAHNADREQLTARLVAAYHHDRTALLLMIGRRAVAQDFADAFRFKKEGP